MDNVELSRLRNVVLAGHAGSGKTTLAEHLLHTAGAIQRLGRVDDGTASLDFEPEEQKRKLSLSLAVAALDHAGHRITIVDTPGYADFIGEVVEGFAAVDAALITMDASGGVEAGTETAISLGRRHNTAALFVLTKCDRENADPTAALDALRAAFGTKIAPLQIAIGKAESFRGYVDLVHRKAFTFDKGKVTEGPDPGRAGGRVRHAPRPAAGGGRRGGRRRPDQVPRGRGHHRRRAGGVPPQGRPREHPGAGPADLREPRHRHQRPARGDRQVPALPHRGAADHGAREGQGGQGRAGSQRTAGRPGLQDHRRPVRRPAHLLPRLLRHHPVARPRLERQPRRGGAHRPGPAPARQGAGARRRAAGRRDRRRGQAGPHGHRRHAQPQGSTAHAAPDRIPGADAPGGHRARVQAGPGQAQLRPPSPGGGGPERPRRAAPGDRRAAALGPGREPDRGQRRAAEAQVRHGRGDATAARGVPRDDPQQDAGRGPAQEAERRARPVRARLAGDRAQRGRRRGLRRERRRRLRFRASSSPAWRRASATWRRRGPSPAIR